MDRLWVFSTSEMYLVPNGDSIVDLDGKPLDTASIYRVPADTSFCSACGDASQLVLVVGKEPLDAEILKDTPVSLPRIALLKADSTPEVRQQLDTLSLDAFVAAPFIAETVNSSLKSALKRDFRDLRDQLKNYSDIAFTAMSSASEMGVVAFYAQTVQSIASFDRLAQQTISCLNDLSVQAYVQFSFEDGVYLFPATASKSHQELLEWIRTSPQRIVSQGRFLIFNFDNAQLLIVDAPVDNPDKYGRLRDVIAHIASIAEARAKTIKVNNLLKAQQENARMVMQLLAMASRDNRQAVKTIMMELSLSLRELGTGMDLTLEQETAMLGLSEKALLSLEGLHEATDAVEEHFRSLLLQLDKAAKLLETDDSNQVAAADSSVELF